ncbi:hypothetical protein IW262DRAFT_1302195 [Armillaria fumosa]|nr:hypothetical protein IW262DRAFT_1302195 [Armillaria fumosa]
MSRRVEARIGLICSLFTISSQESSGRLPVTKNSIAALQSVNDEPRNRTLDVVLKQSQRAPLQLRQLDVPGALTGRAPERLCIVPISRNDEPIKIGVRANPKGSNLGFSGDDFAAQLLAISMTGNLPRC